MKLHESALELTQWWQERGPSVLTDTPIGNAMADLGHEESKGYFFLTIKVPYKCCDLRMGSSLGFSELDIEKQETKEQLRNLAESKLSILKMSIEGEYERHTTEDHREVSTL